MLLFCTKFGVKVHIRNLPLQHYKQKTSQERKYRKIIYDYNPHRPLPHLQGQPSDTQAITHRQHLGQDLRDTAML